MGSIGLIPGMDLKTLLNLGKHSIGHSNNYYCRTKRGDSFLFVVLFSLASFLEIFTFLCLKCYADKEDNLMLHVKS